jgi:hypothetical protein
VSEVRAAALAGQFRLLRFRKIQKGFLVGFASVELSNGLQIMDLVVIAKGGKCWVNMPGKARLDSNGVPLRDAGGRILYDAVGRWNSRELGNRFSVAVIQLIERHHPGVLPAHNP